MGGDLLYVFLKVEIDTLSPARIRLDLKQWDFSSRHIIGQGNKRPPAWQNWIRIGVRCESVVAAKTAAASPISLSFQVQPPPVTWKERGWEEREG